MFDKNFMVSMRGNGHSGFRVKQLLFAFTGVYHTPTIRPYSTHLTNNTLTHLQEVTNGGNNLEKETLSSVAGEILKPSVVSQGNAIIVNGFNEKRLRFLMSVEHIGQTGASLIQYISGYTDFPGISNNNNKPVIDNRMKLYFNSVINVRKTMYNNGRSIEEYVNLSQASHVLSGKYTPTLSDMNNVSCLIRPKDIFNSIGISESAFAGHQIFDCRNTFGDGIQLSRISNNVPTSYLSEVLKHGKAAIEDENSDSLSSIMDKASGLSQEPSISYDAILNTLSIHTNEFKSNGFVTIGELKRLDPNLDDNIVVTINNSSIVNNSGSTALNTEHFNGSNYETIIATILQHSIPALMVECMLTSASLSLTNMTLDSSWSIIPRMATTFADNNLLPKLFEQFKHKLIYQTLRSISSNNQIGITLHLDFHLNGDSVIKIGYNGGFETPFVIPSFADGLFSPVISRNRDVANTISNDVTSLLNNLQIHHSSSNVTGNLYDANKYGNFDNGI